MTTRRLEALAREEQETDVAPDDWPKTRRMRHAMMHGGASVKDFPGTGLFVAMHDLREIGWHTTKTRDNGSTVYMAAPGNGKKRPAGTRKRGRPRKAAQPQPELQPIAAPELGANLVVTALLAHDGDVVVGLLHRDGRRWFAVLTEPPLP